MILKKLFLELINEAPKDKKTLDVSKQKKLEYAVINRHPITFDYNGPRKGKDRVKAGGRFDAEGVTLGYNKKGNLVLRAYIDTPSRSKRGTPSDVGNEKANYGWRTFLVSRMGSIVVLDMKTFDVKRPKYKGASDKSMSSIIATALWTKKHETKKVVKPTKAKTEKPAPPIEKPTQPEKPTPPVEKPIQPEKPTAEPLPEPSQIEKPTEKPEVPQQKEPVEPAPQVKQPSVEKPEPIVSKTKKPLPQPKPIEKPSKPEEEPNAGEEEDNTLKENIMRIKRLMLL